MTLSYNLDRLIKRAKLQLEADRVDASDLAIYHLIGRLRGQELRELRGRPHGRCDTRMDRRDDAPVASAEDIKEVEGVG